MNETTLAELLDSIGPNTNFKLFPYYAMCFDLVPSTALVHKSKSKRNPFVGMQS